MAKMQLEAPNSVYYLVLLSLLAIIHGFVIEDTCIANGAICQGDTDCCSNWCIF